MLFSSPLQLLVLCAVAVVAWLLGFATNPTTVDRSETMRKLARDFRAFRMQSQSRLNTLARQAATLEGTHQTMVDRLAEAEARIVAFTPRGSTPAETAHTLLGDDGVNGPVAEDAADPIVPPLTPGESAAPPPEVDAFPDLANGDTAVPVAATPAPAPDVLTRIDGIDAALDVRLSELGITHFADIEHLSDQDEMALELRLALPAGYITGRQWRQQATALRDRDPASTPPTPPREA